jgi:hypothetical protein
MLSLGDAQQLLFHRGYHTASNPLMKGKRRLISAWLLGNCVNRNLPLHDSTILQRPTLLAMPSTESDLDREIPLYCL